MHDTGHGQFDAHALLRQVPWRSGGTADGTPGVPLRVVRVRPPLPSLEGQVAEAALRLGRVCELRDAVLAQGSVGDAELRELAVLAHLTANAPPRWLGAVASRVFVDTETLYMPDDPAVVEAVRAAGASNPVPFQRLAMAVTMDGEGEVRAWVEEQAQELVHYLLSFDEVVSFNGLGFDNHVLAAYGTPQDARELARRTFDLMQYLADGCGRRLGLDHWAQVRLGRRKVPLASVVGQDVPVPNLIRSGDASVAAWVWTYCYRDVDLTCSLYEDLEVTQRAKVAFFLRFLQRWEERLESLLLAPAAKAC